MSEVKDNIRPGLVRGLGARCWRCGLAAAGMYDSRLMVLLNSSTPNSPTPPLSYPCPLIVESF